MCHLMRSQQLQQAEVGKPGNEHGADQITQGGTPS